MLKYFTFVTLCCLSTCALGLQCDFHPYATADSVLDIQLQSQDSRAAFTLSSMALVPLPGTSAIGALSAAVRPMGILSGPQPTAMLPAVNETTASLDVPSLPLARFSAPAASSGVEAVLHAALLQAELQVQADRLAQKELPGRNSLATIPGSSEASIVPVARHRHRRDRRITSLTAFSQPMLLPNEKMVTPAQLAAMSSSQAFSQPILMPPTPYNPRLTVTSAQVFADAANTHVPKPHFLQAAATPGTAFAALADASEPASQRPHSAVKPVELPTVIDLDQDED